MSNPKTTRRPVSFKIKPCLKAAADRLADEDGRTVGNYLESLIKAAVEAKAAKDDGKQGVA